jgi:ABC-type oligopeptide transport system substrate-binding subunit
LPQRARLFLLSGTRLGATLQYIVNQNPTGRIGAMTRHFMQIAAGTAALLLASTALASAQSVLYRGNDTDPATLDQHRTSTVAESNLLRDLYEGLVTNDPAGAVIPAVAESLFRQEGTSRKD